MLFLFYCAEPDEVIELLPEVVEVVAGQDGIVDVSGRRIEELDWIESGAARADVALAYMVKTQ